MTDLTAIPVTAPDGSTTDLSAHQGKVLLVVNVASQCGFTVVAFPCNQFGQQEPGDAEEIANFCKLSYDVSFPLMGKIDVNGGNAAPIYDHLKNQAPGLLGTKAIKWNFTKFLVDRSGKVVKRYAPQAKPEELAKDIEALI